MKIELSHDLKLPLDVVTQAVGILAKRRAGKSYTARKLVEQLLAKNMQTVVVDPKGDWWGLRSAADGKRPGFPIVILGGDHGDVPLEVSGGELVAKLVVEQRTNVLLDLSLFRKHEVATFMTAFMENLYRLKAREQYRTPVMLVVDEADAIAPQKPQHGEERMLGAAEDIVRRGGQRGIGCTLITQRSAVLNKNVLTQVQILIALRTIAPQDLAALNAWIDVHGTPDERKVLMESLPSLPVGDAWVWSPGWPTNDGIFKRVHVAEIETFDSGATPKPGEKRVEPKQLADVDIDLLRVHMAETVQRVKDNDPKALKAEVAKLRAEVAKAQKASPPAPVKVEQKRVEVPILKEMDIKRLEAAAGRMVEAAEALEGHADKLRAAADQVLGRMALVVAPVPPPRQAAATPIARRSPAAAARPRPAGVGTAAADVGGLTGSQKKVLDALAWFEAFGIRQPTREALAPIAQTRPTSGGFKNNLGALRSAGLIDYPTGGTVALTAAGIAAAAPPDIDPTNEAMHEAAVTAVTNAQASILRALIGVYPASVTREHLALAVGVPETSGGFKNNLGALRTLGFIDYPAGGQVVAADILFPAAVTS